MNSIKRYELKYYISDKHYQILAYRLKEILSPDFYSTPLKGYFIRSLYFDSYDDEALSEKLSGTIYRKKYRLRIYDTNTDKVKFEIKNKLNNQIHKQTATISKETAQKLINGEFDSLLDYDDPLLHRVYTKFITKAYTPKVLIDYTRDAFVYDHFNVRITIDKYLSSNNTNFDIFDDSLHTIPVILEGKHILEIKFTEILPSFIRDILQIDSFERMAISKYTLSRRFFKLNKWEDN